MFELVSLYGRESQIRGFPDHATFREKSVTAGLVGQAYRFPLFDHICT